MEKINLEYFKKLLNDKLMEFSHPIKTDFHKDYPNDLHFEKSGYLSLNISFSDVFDGSGYISEISIYSPITNNDLLYIDEIESDTHEFIINKIVNNYCRLSDLLQHFQELMEEFSDLDLDNEDFVELIKIK